MTDKSTKKQAATPARRRSNPPRQVAPKAAPENESAENDFPIVGVGASAGGLEAFTLLLQALPRNPGIALVFVQHLAPSHESALTALLSRTTPLSVSLVQDGVRVEPNHVYVIPPDRNMAVLNGRLNLLPRAETVGRHLPIDYFLRSLAGDQKHRAVGVLLSGTGSDGTLGLQAIKAEGGLTYVQSRDSAKYDGMPASAIAADVVDFVLPPKEIAGELARVGNHAYVRETLKTPPEDLTGESENAFNKILITLRMETGINFVQYKPTTLRRRIARRMVLHKIDTLELYLRYLKQDPSELARLCQDLLINVTGFFRDPETFDALKRHAFPRLFEHRSSEAPVRIWVPGCSTGEEAYSIAIVLLEYLGERAVGMPIQIFSTDVNDAVIARARAGIYLENIAAEVSAERLSRFFAPVVGGYQISKAVRAMCAFSRQDITRDPPFSKLDLISCRNVLIYMSPVLQRIVIPTFHFALNPGGVLMLGNSETIGEFSDLFTLADKTHKLYVKKSNASRPVHALTMPRPGDVSAPTRLPPPVFKNDLDIQRAADQIALSRYAPSGVVVDDNGDIIQFRGSTGVFLEPASGAASLNLLKMARPGLMVELRTALNQARNSTQPVRKEDIQFKGEGGFRRANLEVIPILPSSGSDQHYFMVVFEPASPARSSKSKPARAAQVPRGSGRAPDRRLTQLEEELAATRTYLESSLEQHAHTNEELRGALEEIQSSNEELQSTNEELETAKEELQATNEELTTLNEELQNRNFELGSVNNDLLNVLANVSIPILMVGGDLRIRRLTPPAEPAFGLIPADTGRPLSDLNLRIVVPDLEKLIRQVLDTLEVYEQEIQDREGHWYSLRIRPYKTVDYRIDGVVLVLIDIDPNKRFREVKAARDYAQAIVETVREPLLVLDGNLRIHTANRAFCQMFQVTREETENRLLYELAENRWDMPRLRELLERILPQNSRFEDFQVEADFPRVGRKRLMLNARRIDRQGEPAGWILLAMEEAKDCGPVSDSGLTAL